MKYIYKRETFQVERPLSIVLAMMSSLVLASCGGGGGGTENPSSPSGNIQTEVINNIIVPTEPDVSTNSTTVVGIDVNRNGVRDDIERNIARQAASKVDFDKAIKIAQTYQIAMTDASITTRAQALSLYQAIACINDTQGTVSETQRTAIINQSTNTGQRLLAMSKFNAKLAYIAPGEVNCGF